MIRDSRKKVGRAVQAIRDFEKAKERLLERVCTTKQVAERFGVSTVTVTRWVQRGEIQSCGDLPGYGLLFDPVAVDQFTPPIQGQHRAARESALRN